MSSRPARPLHPGRSAIGLFGGHRTGGRRLLQITLADRAAHMDTHSLIPTCGIARSRVVAACETSRYSDVRPSGRCLLLLGPTLWSLDCFIETR